MKTTSIKILGWCVWVTIMPAVVVAPWFFGAWEMWWFWLFAAFPAMGLACFGLRLSIGGGGNAGTDRVHGAWRIGSLAIPFLVYAVVRGLAAPVFMDAERSVLLHVSGAAVAVLVVFGMEWYQRRLLFVLLFGSLSAMAIYGIVNHMLFNSQQVLWMPAYEQYTGRATGPYYCPDHFAGALELLFCMSAGVLLDRTTRRVLTRSLAVVAAILAVVGVLLSKSRGAGMTLIVIGVGILIWGFAQWPRAVRWYWRLITISATLLLVIACLQAFPAYAERFSTYGGMHQVRTGDGTSLKKEVLSRLRQTSRGRMYGGAWRAWKSAPWMGIGPGMHQHLWPRFAATPDGNAERGIWPTMANETFHSYEVHSDWLQLLEEYGITGLVLFLFPFCAMALYVRQKMSRETRHWRGIDEDQDSDFAYTLCGALALWAMAFHSLGDFNLQMPGTVWMLAALLGIALAGPDRGLCS